MARPDQKPEGRSNAPARRRTRAREVAVQFLYQLDLRGDEVLADLKQFLDDSQESGALRDEDARSFCERLILGVHEHRTAIDESLQKVAKNWVLDRMATVDRNVLRMAAFELLYCHDVPPKVSINEAIEIGKSYSTANTGSFVNGILDRIRIDYAKRDPDSVS
ncbi:MAG: transcription antitermination factor NusB [Planctomycetota bacterium]